MSGGRAFRPDQADLPAHRGRFTVWQLATVRRLDAQIAIANPGGTATIILHADSSAPATYNVLPDGKPLTSRGWRWHRPSGDYVADCLALATVSGHVVEDPVRLFAANLRAERYARGLTQEKVANAAQIDMSYYGRIERAEIEPGVRMATRVASALGIRVSQLMEGIE